MIDRSSASSASTSTTSPTSSSATACKLFAGRRSTSSIKAIKEKQAKILQTRRIGQTAVLGDVRRGRRTTTLADFEAKDAIKRMWAKDASLWKADPRPRQDHRQRPGLAERRRRGPAPRRRARDVRRRDRRGRLHAHRRHGHGRVEPLRRGPPPDQHPRRRPPELIVLDSTVPATIRRIEAEIDPAKTLFVVVQQERHDHRAVGLLRLLLRQGEGDQGGQGRRELRRDHRPRHQDGGRRQARRLPPDLPQPARHRRPVLGPVLLRHGPRRP